MKTFEIDIQQQWSKRLTIKADSAEAALLIAQHRSSRNPAIIDTDDAEYVEDMPVDCWGVDETMDF